MIEEKTRIHSLDELFGKNKDLFVEWEGKRYSLKHPDSFSPVEMNRFDSLSKRSVELHFADKEEMSDADSEALGEITRELIELLNPRLAERLTFLQQISVLRFHAEEVRKSFSSAEKKTTPELTGETSLPE